MSNMLLLLPPTACVDGWAQDQASAPSRKEVEQGAETHFLIVPCFPQYHAFVDCTALCSSREEPLSASAKGHTTTPAGGTS